MFYLQDISIKNSNYSFNVIFNETPGLYEGDDVKMFGKKIGLITDIRIIDKKVTVELSIDNSFAFKIPIDSKIQVKSEGFLGTKYISIASGTDNNKFIGQMKENDVVILPNHFKNPKEGKTIYQSLLEEMESCGVPPEELWKLWHGDTHFIADDRLAKKMGFDWKEKCPTFNMVIETMKDFFDMDVKATRFNLYKDNTEWKPYHHDAAAIDERKAKTQNFTVGVTFGATRPVSFQNAKTKTRIDFPLGDGSVYTFAKQVNVDWMHGITQEPKVKKEGRISIILWGKNKQTI